MIDTVPSVEPGEHPGEPHQHERAWPSAVRQELARRRARLFEGPVGRVLDLSESGTDDPRERFDTIVSVGALVRFADLSLAIRGIARLLEPDGQFLFVEPVGRPGWWGLAQASAGAALAPVRDQHVGRDVPLAVRAGGFIITDIERFTMPTSVWPLRPFVHGRAVLTPEPLR